jgi:hypothetical protein
VSAGKFFTCALGTKRAIITCWGDNTYGQREPPLDAASSASSSDAALLLELTQSSHSSLSPSTDQLTEFSDCQAVIMIWSPRSPVTALPCRAQVKLKHFHTILVALFSCVSCLPSSELRISMPGSP